MEASRNVIGLVGSPNPDGRTYQLVSAALEGAGQAGVATELIQMSDHVVAACRDCLTWVCKDNLKCTFADDAFEFYSRKIMDFAGRKSDALIEITKAYNAGLKAFEAGNPGK